MAIEASRPPVEVVAPVFADVMGNPPLDELIAFRDGTEIRIDRDARTSEEAVRAAEASMKAPEPRLESRASSARALEPSPHHGP